MEKITKSQKYAMIEEILTVAGGDNADMLIAFVQSEQAALARKAAKAKEKAAEKQTTIDELGNAVLAVLTDEPQTGDDIFAAIDVADASLAKVRARLTKLVDNGYASRVEVKGVTASGKKTTRMAYTLANGDAE